MTKILVIFEISVMTKLTYIYTLIQTGLTEVTCLIIQNNIKRVIWLKSENMLY